MWILNKIQDCPLTWPMIVERGDKPIIKIIYKLNLLNEINKPIIKVKYESNTVNKVNEPTIKVKYELSVLKTRLINMYLSKSMNYKYCIG